ncbi:major facilitator superfamily domain-containing protein [Aspergillus pseudonomiae]|uniref:Major facilitator superfamily domain-containing protein n=1 Tax=Aspergillus pseudonomiae TaxID=1506151 RepID=A0A5N7DQ07_9EURO|nr:major facilitator superfamily domain-containing protein [Aspergillus pseudonomiae]KAE8408113.1 major facilitator superfamily domain-containing protein [Aspergillus pseudonomiae]
MAPVKNRNDLDKPGFSPAEEEVGITTNSHQRTDRNLQKIHREVDFRILLWYSFVYLIMRIDVTNISNAAIINIEEGNGIKKELGNLSSEQWAWALSIFYYPYMFFEPASTVLLKRWSPSIWMSRIMITWGIISMCQGATRNYGGILATRFFLGLAEAGFYPGVLYHLSFWYNTDRMPLRLAFFYASGVFSGTISGLLAYAISFMNKAGGLSGWRWVFILEGIPPILCGVYTYFFLPNYPETSDFLSESEKQTVLEGLSSDAPKMKAKTFQWEEVKILLRDPTMVTFSLLWITHGIGGWGISFVLPTVIYELGMTNTGIAQLMSMPPSSLAFLTLVILGYFIHQDKLNCWIVAIALELVSIISYIILLTTDNTIVKYIFIMISNAAASCVYPVIWPERIRAVKGTTSSALAIGITNACAQLMGIVGPQVYQSKFGPSYHVSYGTSIGLLSGTVIFIVLSWRLLRQRK